MYKATIKIDIANVKLSEEGLEPTKKYLESKLIQIFTPGKAEQTDNENDLSNNTTLTAGGLIFDVTSITSIVKKQLKNTELLNSPIDAKDTN